MNESEVPQTVRDRWKACHDALQAHLELFFRQRGSGTTWGELHYEAGVPRAPEFTSKVREQASSREAVLQATRRKANGE